MSESHGCDKGEPLDKFHIRISIDVAMAAVLVAVMATSLVQQALHEYLGLTLFALMVAHVIGHRRRFAHLVRSGRGALSVLRTVAVAGLIACVIGQIVSCVVLSEYALWWLPAYMTGQVEFASAASDALSPLTVAQYASMAVLIAGGFYCLGCLARGSRSLAGSASLKSREGNRR